MTDTSTQSVWMVRAGEGGQDLDRFLSEEVVALGLESMEAISPGEDRETITRRIREIYPAWSKGKVSIWAGQLFRFVSEMKKGDKVLTYDTSRRVYHLGEVTGESTYDAEFLPEIPEYRKVRWETEIPRDQLSTTTKNSLGAISTLFQLPDHAAAEVLKVAQGNGRPEETESAAEEAEENVLADIRWRAQEFIKDRINALDPREMEELTAALLRAMGYKTRVTPAGPDRGVDIMASPDGLGFEQPRIIAEVKHRGDTSGAQAVRSFLGGRHQEDKGLFVSTGGFTKDARYEADRASIPLTLMDLDGLVTSLLEHYEKLDEEGKTLIPLTKVYWPT